MLSGTSDGGGKKTDKLRNHMLHYRVSFCQLADLDHDVLKIKSSVSSSSCIINCRRGRTMLPGSKQDRNMKTSGCIVSKL